MTGAWEWKRFADIKTGDVVPLALNQLIGEPQRVSLPPLPARDDADVHAPREMSSELAELVGYFMGSGVVDARGIRWSVVHGDFDVAERLQLFGKALFGLQAEFAQEAGRTEMTLVSPTLSEWWRMAGFGNEPRPRIPDAVLATNDREVYAAFLRGLYEADGSVTAGYPHWATGALEFSHDVQSLLLALGYPTSRKMDITGREQAPMAVLRLLNFAENERWLHEIGFISGRKNAQVQFSVAKQAARADHIPLPRALVERLAPDNDRMRRVLLLELRRGTISRQLAAELLERTDDDELRRLLGFFYDGITSADLGEEELTYDLSVPDNVTYIANGFVSHNTIGLMMDCDTTGIEPDLGLCKTKKLVGGGTMSIVNQTVPRALRQLGYDDAQVTEVIAYIDEHKSIIGAPHVQPDHLPVFACSMGDLTIHHMGHVKMMAAAQPWLSGAISKTVNVPETATVDDMEHVYIESWRLGLKAVAIYRDNCKVAQPLSTTKKEGKPEMEPKSEAERVVETVVIKEPVRQKLPRKRTSKTFSFRVADCHGYVTVGEFDDGRPGELFLKVAKQGSTLAGVMDAFAISVSMGLQYGVPLRAYVEKFINVRFEPAGMTDDPDLRFASSLVDYIFRRLAVEYMPIDERMELGILSVDERLQPTLPGVEEMATPTSTGADLQPTITTKASTSQPSLDLEPDVQVAAADAPYCYSCGNLMQRAGSCYVCSACGTTSGCS